ncbi:Rz1-like lysis system protein LysC [Acinetobacter seifertii]|uniref:Rz1-like lysis system protein LysC n=1 Tax=Acinetobacter seifertii TaxID=1530123 RepID=UPI00403A3637
MLSVKCKRSLNVLFISLAVLILTGCNKSTILSKPVIPANLIQPCSNLNEIEGTTGKDLMIWSVDTVAKYNDCKARHGAIVKALE